MPVVVITTTQSGSELASPPPVPELAVWNSWDDRERGKPVPCVFLHIAVPHVVWACATTDHRLHAFNLQYA